jgi:hypothetical protein
MKIHALKSVVPVVSALLLGAAGCSDPASPEGDGALQVRAFARGLETSASAGGDVLSVEIERVYLVLGRVKLEKAADGTEDFTDERSVVVELGPGDEQVLALSTEVPPGTYKEIELAIDKLERGHPIEQGLIHSYPGLDNASLLVAGTVTRAGSGARPFSFATDLDIDLEIGFVPPLFIETIEPGAALLSLVFDASGWFRNPSGLLIDPTAAANRSMIESSIQKSIEFFEDSNRDGRR